MKNKLNIWHFFGCDWKGTSSLRYINNSSRTQIAETSVGVILHIVWFSFNKLLYWFFIRLSCFYLSVVYLLIKQSQNNIFLNKPYLEILRLIYHFGTLSFDEIMLFGLQMTSYKMFDDIVKKIENFRIDKIKCKCK